MGSSLLRSFIPLKHLLCAGYYGTYGPRPSKTPHPDHRFIMWGVRISIHPAMWYLARLIHSQLKPICRFHINQDFTAVNFGLLFDFGFSPICSLSHNHTRAATKRWLLKNSPTISLPSHISSFLFNFHLVSVHTRPTFHSCNKYGETFLHSAFFTEK